MSEKKIQIPDGMIKAVSDSLRWLIENPIEPTDEQSESLFCADLIIDPNRINDARRAVVTEWQRRMFLAPEPEENPKYPSDVIRSIRQIYYDLSTRCEETSIPLVVECLADILHSMGENTPEPEAVKDLLVKHINSEGALNGPEHKASDARYAHNAAVAEAYHRGKKEGK